MHSISALLEVSIESNDRLLPILIVRFLLSDASRLISKFMICRVIKNLSLSYAGNFVADENGSTEPLRVYKEKTLVIVLPGDLTVFDIGKKERKKDEIIVMLLHFFSISEWLSVWCIAFFVDFGHVQIPKNLNIPPSLRMLGVEPQTKLNCEVLDPSQGFEVRWAIGEYN